MRIADGTDIGDYLDYLFGRNDAEETGTMCEQGQEKERQESSMGDMLEINRNKEAQGGRLDKMIECPYQKGYICMRPFMKRYEDIVCGECNSCSCDGSPPPES